MTLRKTSKSCSKNKFGAETKGKYKSKLEVYCAQQLEHWKIPFEYEPTSFMLMKGFDFDSSWEKWGKTFKQVKKVQNLTYKPDFIGDKWVIETKGMRTEAFNIRWKLFKHYILAHNIPYHLFAPSNQKEVDVVIEMIKIL